MYTYGSNFNSASRLKAATKRGNFAKFLAERKQREEDEKFLATQEIEKYEYLSLMYDM